MKQVLSKLAQARLYIKSHPVKKDASNKFSNYEYFSPELVSKLVTDACIESNLICLFNLKQDQLGYFGEVILTDMESGEVITTEMRTARPEIKATNETQQMGGMNTYTKRYALMSLFDIEDNTIDFDAQDNTKRQEKNDDKPWLNENSEHFKAAVDKLSKGQTTIEKIGTVYKISKAVRAKLEAAKHS